jgi:hypothetical protein
MKMPEYTYNGLSTYYATTCRECAAACGLVVARGDIEVDAVQDDLVLVRLPQSGSRDR